MKSPDTLPGSSPETFTDNHGNHPEPFCQQPGMAGPQHGLRQIHAARSAQRHGTAPTVGVYAHARDNGRGDGGSQMIGSGYCAGHPDFRGINSEQPHTHVPVREGVPVNDPDILRDVNGRPVRFDRRGPYGEHQPEQRREQPQDNRPNLLRRLIASARAMGTPGEWAEDATATILFMASIVAFSAFVLMFAT